MCGPGAAQLLAQAQASAQSGQYSGLSGGGSEGYRLSPQEVLARNQGFAKPAPPTGYVTQLPPQDEANFQQWAQQNDMHTDPPSNATSDYDMRGFWRAVQAGDPRAVQAIDPNDKQMHQPDFWKTPYDLTFSRESQYAQPNAPSWNDADQLVTPDGRVIFDDRAHQYYPVTPPAGGPNGR